MNDIRIRTRVSFHGQISTTIIAPCRGGPLKITCKAPTAAECLSLTALELGKLLHHRIIKAVERRTKTKTAAVTRTRA